MKKLLVLFSFLWCSSLNAQVGLLPENHIALPEIPALTLASLQVPTLLPAHADQIQASQPVPLVYSYNDLAFFCKVEVKLEKVVQFPVKFRLGSVDYVDYLEGK